MSGNERLRVNLINLCVCLGVLFVAVQVSNGSFATRINTMTKSLDKALTDIMDENPADYTNLTDDAVYVSDAAFNSKGMAGLYNLTNSFMELILSKDFYPEGES